MALRQKQYINWLYSILPVLLLAAVLRIIYLQEYFHSPFWNLLTVDNYYHWNWAQVILQGDILGDTTYFRAPFYVFCLALLFKLFGVSLLAARIFGLLIGLGSIYMTYRIGCFLSGKGIGLAAAAVQAVYPVTMYFEGELLLDPLFTLVLQGAVYQLLRWYREQSSRTLLWAGLLTGLAAITRPTGLLILPVMIICSLFSANHRRHLGRSVLVLCTGIAVFVGPVFVRNLTVAGDPVLIASQGGINFYLGNHETADGVSASMPEPLGFNWRISDITYIADSATGRHLKPGEISSYWTGVTLHIIASDPWHFLKLFADKLNFIIANAELSNNRGLQSFFDSISLLRWNPLSFGLLFPLALVGGIVTIRKRTGTGMCVVPLLIVLYTLVLALFFITSRFRLPLLPFLMVLAAMGAKLIVHAIRSRSRTIVGYVLLLLAAGYVSFEPPAAIPTATGALQYFSTGNYRLHRDDYSGALEAYRDAARLSPDQAEINLNTGIAFLKQRQTDSARFYFEREHRLFPRRASALTNLASLALITEDIESADSLTQLATRLKPYDPLAAQVRVRALAHDSLTNGFELKAVIDTCLENTQWNLSLAVEGAVALLDRNLTDAAAEILERAVGVLPPPVETDDMLFSSGFRVSRREWQKSKAKAFYLLAYVHMSRKAYGLAEDYVRQSIAVDSTLSASYILLSESFRARGDFVAADSIIVHTYKRFPDDTLVQQYYRLHE